jgi:hypothetical protein
MTRHRWPQSLLASLLLIAVTWIVPPAAAEEPGIALLLPPGAAIGEKKEDALSDLKRQLGDAGYELVIGEYNPGQDLPLVETGKTTGIVTYESGDQSAAERLQERLVELYPEIVIEERQKKGSPFPEGSLGVLLPHVVVAKKPEQEPPPWDLTVQDVTVEVDGALDGAAVSKLVEEHASDLMACWPKAVTRNLRMEGPMRVKVMVSGSGEPFISTIEEAEAPDEPWVNCVSEAFLGWSYPGTRDGKSASVFIGLRFAIDESPPPPPPAEEPAEEPAETPAAE